MSFEIACSSLPSSEGFFKKAKGGFKNLNAIKLIFEVWLSPKSSPLDNPAVGIQVVRQIVDAVCRERNLLVDSNLSSRNLNAGRPATPYSS